MCEQRDGDAVFVPGGWAHATLNLQASVGVAFELDLGTGTAHAAKAINKATATAEAAWQ